MHRDRSAPCGMPEADRIDKKFGGSASGIPPPAHRSAAAETTLHPFAAFAGEAVFARLPVRGAGSRRAGGFGRRRYSSPEICGAASGPAMRLSASRAATL